MRRMNYNPFKKPFASGEYDHNNNYFSLDKALEPNHIYYIVIHSSDGYTLGPSFFDLRNQEQSASLVPMWDSNDELNVFHISGGLTPARILSIGYITTPLSTEYQYTIFVYQLI